MFCPECKVGYQEGFTICADCNVALVESLTMESVEETVVEPRIVFVSSSVHEANLVKGLLEGSGIEVHLRDENISRLNPFYTNAVGGIKLVVKSGQEALAREVLEEYRTGQGQSATTGKITPFDGFVKAMGEEEPPLNTEPPSTHPCLKCGMKNDPDSNYCDQCGEPLS